MNDTNMGVDQLKDGEPNTMSILDFGRYLFYWSATLLCGGLSVIIILSNYRIVLGPLMRKPVNSSIGPFVGGLLGFVAIMACPIERVHEWWWLPAVIDPGSALYSLYIVPWFAWMTLKGEFKMESFCRDCVERIKRHTIERTEETDGNFSGPYEALPHLVQGVCPTCGGTNKKSMWS